MMNWQSGARLGSPGRLGIGRERSPNTRVWSGRRPAARSRTTARRNGRGSIDDHVAQLFEAGRQKFLRLEWRVLVFLGIPVAINAARWGHQGKWCVKIFKRKK